MSILLRKLKRWSSRTTLVAVSDDELEEWLLSLGMLDSVLSGDVDCLICGEPMSLEALQLVARVEGKIVVCCAKLGCIQAFANVTGGKADD